MAPARPAKIPTILLHEFNCISDFHREIVKADVVSVNDL